MKNLQIGEITVPLIDYAVGASAVLGIRDSGKTVTSKGIAEQLLDNGVPIIVFDAVGKWRWMKVPAEENGKSYKVVVAGGNAPDLPLTPESTPEIVRAAIKERIPLIIDLYHKSMSKGQWRKIVQTAIRIIHYENENGPVHVFLEEAAEFVPQKVMDGETYAEVEKLVRMGGNASVGITIINQRSQEVNKAVLDQCSTALILGCQVGRHAIAAVSGWIERLDEDTAKEVTKSLPHLAAGEAWVWTRKNLVAPTRQQLPMCRSYHPDRRTPEETLRKMAGLSTNTVSFVERMSERIPKVLEEAKANDPTALKQKIADLERKLRIAEQKAPEPQQIITEDNKKLLSDVLHDLEEMIQLHHRFEVNSHLTHIKQIFEKVSLAGTRSYQPAASRSAPEQVTRKVASPVRPAGDVSTNGEVTGAQRTILQTCAMLDLRGITADVQVVAAWLGLHPNGGSYRGNIRFLHDNEYLENFVPTPKAAGYYGSFGTGLGGVHAAIKPPQSEIVTILERDESHTIGTLAEALGLHENGGSFRGNVRRLMTMGVVTPYSKTNPKIKLTPAAFK